MFIIQSSIFLHVYDPPNLSIFHSIFFKANYILSKMRIHPPLTCTYSHALIIRQFVKVSTETFISRQR